MPKVALAIAGAVFGDLVRDGIRFAAAIVAVFVLPALLVVVIVAMFLTSTFSGFGGGGSEPPPIPLDQLAVMVDVSNATGVPWSLLAAIASVESAFGANMATSWAGAIGYGQFMPASWAHWGAGDPYEYWDALPAMARYLLDHNVLNDIPNAVYAYNHSWEYVSLVLSRMVYYETAFHDEAVVLGATVFLAGAEALP